MPAIQKINSDVWEFWSITHKAWADGKLNDINPEYQAVANSAMSVEQFADTAHMVVRAIKELKPEPDEFLIAWNNDADFLMTNKRLMIRRSKAGHHDILTFADMLMYSESGWWTKTIEIKMRDGRTMTYRNLGGSVKPEFIQYAIAKATHGDAKSTNDHGNNTEYAVNTGGVDMDNEEMIGSEFPQFQALIKNRLQPGETVVAFTTATTKIGGSGAAWIPFVGTTLELARGLTLKPYLLAVTSSRLLIIQFNRFSGVKKEVKEVAFDEVPLQQIRSAMSSKRTSFVYSLMDGDSLKMEFGDGRKYHFRNITADNANMIRDAILGQQAENA